jgi:WD40 repeat protein
VTAIEFSPDGVLVASADRAGGLHVWESHSGQLFHDLVGHKGPVSDVSWRPDSNVLVSASEDLSLKLWGMEEGNQIKSWNAPAGVTAVEFTRDGRIASAGRDKRVRLWKQDGAQIREFPPLAEIGLEVAFDAETERVLGGDLTGVVKVWTAEKGEEVGQFSTKPLALSEQIKALESRLTAAEAAAAAPPPEGAAPKEGEAAAPATPKPPAAPSISSLRAQLDAVQQAANRFTAN